MNSRQQNEHMQGNTTDINPISFLETTTGALCISDDYSDILKFYNLEYITDDYYLQVRKIDHVQGWILHISVVVSQVPDMLKLLIPLLTAEELPFKMIANKEACLYLLNGSFGIAQLGKVLSIYPRDEIQALQLAQKLVKLTRSFKGPDILTDIHLGTVIYTRYGSCNPILQTDPNGQQNKYIYDSNGQLVKDPYNIPFKLPAGVKWPFTGMASSAPPTPKKVFNHRAKAMSTLKQDTRGNVYKGVYVKGLFRTAPCVIKEGKKNMVSEDNGRDMHDRLVWQHYIHTQLADTVPVPKIYDFFEEDGNTYLVMEFIDGISLENHLKHFTADRMSWHVLTVEEQQLLLQQLLTIISIIERVHEKGYVHRDIQHANFIITKHNQIYLIDLELSWSLTEKYPDPAFQLGTPGFMSPEQQVGLPPTIKEDIYGLGALMTGFFTGFSPIKFNTEGTNDLLNNLAFFIGNEAVAEMIMSCLSYDPQLRPDLLGIKSIISNYAQSLSGEKAHPTHNHSFSKLSYTNLDIIIKEGLYGLLQDPTVINGGFWYSKRYTTENQGASEHKEYTRKPGLREGVAGILYTLGRAHRTGYNIDFSSSACQDGWTYIEERKSLNEISVGFYEGIPGIAVAQMEWMKAALSPSDESNSNRLQHYFSPASDTLDVHYGVAGQGIALLHCKSYLEIQFAEKLLEKYLNAILDQQEKDGSWILRKGDGKQIRQPIGLSRGISGITWFLLQYSRLIGNDVASKSAAASLKWLNNRTNQLDKLFDRDAYQQIMGNESEWTGIILTYIKAYEVLQEDLYKQIAEKALRNYPAYIINNTFIQDMGISNLGELYLEAWRVFKSEEWMERARWIANIFIHTAFRNGKGSCYWQLDQVNPPTADLITGTCGIIHFLLNIQHPEQLSYRIIS